MQPVTPILFTPTSTSAPGTATTIYAYPSYSYATAARYGCHATCTVCGAFCNGAKEHEPPFHGCSGCGHLWHVAGYEHISLPQQFDYSQFNCQQAELEESMAIKTFRQQFDEALRCETVVEAEGWLSDEVQFYIDNYGMEPDEAGRVILYNLGYMTGYFSEDVQKKIYNLFGVVHPIFGTPVKPPPTPEEAIQAGVDMAESFKRDGTILLQRPDARIALAALERMCRKAAPAESDETNLLKIE